MRRTISSKSGWRSSGERVRLGPGPAGAGVAVDDRELDLALVGVEVEEELVHLVHDLGDARVGPVDLVHDEDHRQPRLERLAQHEPGLGERPLARVDEQEDAVDHRQPALDLAAEVGVSRRVDDVDLRLAVADGRVLGQDRDPLLALQVARVHAPARPTSWFARNAPDCQSIASTSVVLPWSTCATIAMLRMSERSGTDRGYRRRETEGRTAMTVTLDLLTGERVFV